MTNNKLETKTHKIRAFTKQKEKILMGVVVISPGLTGAVDILRVNGTPTSYDVLALEITNYENDFS